MRHNVMLLVGVALVVVGLVVTFAGNTGSGISVPALVVGGLLFVSGGTLALTAYRLKQFARQTGGHPDGGSPRE